MKKGIIIGLVIGVILTITTVYAAYKYQATDVGYTPSNNDFKVDNVESAISELYDKTNNCKEYYSKATYVAPKEGETHKGIVYLDPTDLQKKCTEKETASNVNENGTPTEIKTGCMKWYVYDDSGDNYTMILDHNTTARIKWNDDNKNVAVGNSNIAPQLISLVNTSSWKVTPRLITAQEIVDIVGDVTTWTSSDPNSWFLFEGTGEKKQTLLTYSSTKRNKYHWLYDYLYGCRGGRDAIDYGCEFEDNNTYTGTGTASDGQILQYWTSTPIGTAGSDSYV